MKPIRFAAIVAAAALVATAAHGQSSDCIPGEGKQVEYDFPIISGTMLPTTEAVYYSPRSWRTCVTGQPDKLTFRGVPGTLKDEKSPRKAIEGAKMLIEAGITDPDAIKALIGRVGAVMKDEATRPQPKGKSAAAEPFNLFSTQK